MSPEAVERRQRTQRLLRREGVPFLADLPPIDSEAESIRRSADQVVDRVIGTYLVTLKGMALPEDELRGLVEEWGGEQIFTREEREFIHEPRPTPCEFRQFAWRSECVWVLMWAAGQINLLGRPEQPCDFARAQWLLNEMGPEGLRRTTRLRSQSELLDAADLVFRYHWATREARMRNQRGPAGLDHGVIQEWHHAVNWLIGYLDQTWDDISVDTR